MQASIRTLIIDDEPLGRERIRTLLENHRGIEILGECADGLEAVEAIRNVKPDLVFLDVQMPKLDGFGVIKEIGSQHMPYVIFVTAYDQHALQAFEVHALDYLLKPFEVPRFEEALKHAVQQLSRKQTPDLLAQVDTLIEDLRTPRRQLDRLMVKTRSRIYFVHTRDIDWIEASGNYVTLHAGGNKHLLRQTTSNLEKQLDAEQFIRIHRSTIVNIDRVKELYSMASGEYEVLLIDGTKLTLSRSYKHVLDRFSA